MTDDPRDSVDEPFEPLTPEDEAEVRGLLAALPDPQLPSEVAQRIAALVGASGSDPAQPSGDAVGTATTAAAGGAGGSDETEATTAAHPLGTDADAHAGRVKGRRRGTWVLQSAAVLVIVALIAAVVVGVTSRGGDSSSPKPLVLSEQPASGPVTTSGRTYTSASLAGQVRGLVAAASTGATPTTTALSKSATGAAGTAATTERKVAALVENPTTRQACIDQLASVSGVHAVTIDVGVYEGKPAAVVVLPDEVDATKVDAWVVGPTCSEADNPFPYRYQRVPRP